MFRLNHVEENQAYRTDLMRRAERQRIVQDALAGRKGRAAFYAPVLVGVGRRMIAWGSALQARYAAAAEQRQPLPYRNPHSHLQPNG